MKINTLPDDAHPSAFDWTTMQVRNAREISPSPSEPSTVVEKVEFVVSRFFYAT